MSGWPSPTQLVLIDNKFITLNLLNKRIQTFPFLGSDATEKPTIISQAALSSSDHSIKQSHTLVCNFDFVHIAAQMWCFIR